MRRLAASPCPVALAVAVVAAWPSTRSADAATRKMPRAITGYAFDACQAPSQARWTRGARSRPTGAWASTPPAATATATCRSSLSAEWVAPSRPAAGG